MLITAFPIDKDLSLQPYAVYYRLSVKEAAVADVVPQVPQSSEFRCDQKWGCLDYMPTFVYPAKYPAVCHRHRDQ